MEEIMKILNLTQHPATPEQKAQGVVDLSEEDRDLLKFLLTFDAIPTEDHMRGRAEGICKMADRYEIDSAMIGGAPYFMGVLEHYLWMQCVTPLYAFSQRVVEEEEQPNGEVRKVSVFKHLGFVQPLAL